MAHLDSRALAQFVAVAEALSFRQAAERLHVSQPPLSRAIRDLEDRLGARLFDRSVRGVALTPAGRHLLPRARRILRLLDDAHAEVRAMANAARVVRVGFTSAVEAQTFAGLLDEAPRRQRPAAEIRPSFDTSPRLLRQLHAGRLDAAFVALPVRDEALSLTEVLRQPMVAALPANHPAARRRRVALADLADGPLLWFERARQPAFFDHCEAIFAQHRFAPPRRKEPADHHVLLAEVAAGRGIALLPASFAALRRPGARYVGLREGDELAVAIALATPKDRPALHRQLLAGLRRAG
jgi:DNA-binding transcriptional LysR family regulator